MIPYNDLKKISVVRLKEAKLLYKNGHYDGAAYICGYVLETALKARICKHLRINEYQDSGKEKNVFMSHDFDRLLLLAGLHDKISLNSRNKKRFLYWSLLTKWKPEHRYTIGVNTKQGVKEILKALEDRNNGILTWIKKIW